MEVEDKSNSLLLGEMLKNTRESRNWEIGDVAKKLGIPELYVKYMENEEFDRLFARIYARNFVKRYAALLKLSIDDVLKMFDEVYQEKIVKEKQEKELSEERHSQISVRVKISYIIVILILSLIAIEVFQIYRFSSTPRMYFVVRAEPEINSIPMELFNSDTRPLKIRFNNVNHMIEANSHFNASLKVGKDYIISLERKNNVSLKVADKTVAVKTRKIELQVKANSGGS